jgi:aminoglycoside phosphotransferase family enzyme
LSQGNSLIRKPAYHSELQAREAGIASKVSRFIFPTKDNKHLRSSGNVKQFVIKVKQNVAPITQHNKSQEMISQRDCKQAAAPFVACYVAAQNCKGLSSIQHWTSIFFNYSSYK